MNHMTRFSSAFVAGGSLVASALSCALLSQSVAAERPPALAGDAFQTASRLVTTAATVREKDGRLVTNLGERDFVVEEDGRPQALARFASERTPLSVAIAIDNRLYLDVRDKISGEWHMAPHALENLKGNLDHMSLLWDKQAIEINQDELKRHLEDQKFFLEDFKFDGDFNFKLKNETRKELEKRKEVEKKIQ
jgi:hypothetical protein